MDQTVQGYYHDSNLFYRLVRTKIFWLIFWSLSFSYPIYRSITRKLPPPLPVYGTIPAFQLTNEFGKPFGSKDLKGKFYIANFMFTSCPTTCPHLMEKMDEVQKRIRGIGTKGQIVTFTVDPEVDSPEVLFRFARKRHSNPFVWNFLTGARTDLQKILIDGFKIPLNQKHEIKKQVENLSITLMDIVHSDKVVLVDDLGRIRGYYSTDSIGIDKLMIDLGLLINNSFDFNKANKKGV